MEEKLLDISLEIPVSDFPRHPIGLRNSSDKELALGLVKIQNGHVSFRHGLLALANLK